MKWYIRLFNFLFNRRGRYAVVDIKWRVREVYINGNEVAYAAYRAITGATVQESHKAVRPWLNEWEGKK
jgi:hypothetical protein